MEVAEITAAIGDPTPKKFKSSKRRTGKPKKPTKKKKKIEVPMSKCFRKFIINPFL